eukprot:Nk52_evm4s304 gene=Nk52_evmTU4s304
MDVASKEEQSQPSLDIQDVDLVSNDGQDEYGQSSDMSDVKEKGFKGKWHRFTHKLAGVFHRSKHGRNKHSASDDEMRNAKKVLKELAIYFVYLLVLMVVVYGMISPLQFWFTNNMEELIVRQSVTASDPNFFGLTTLTQFWSWLENLWIPAVYAWNNNYIYQDNKLLGVPQLRQLQVEQGKQCKIPSDFENLIFECYAPYTKANEFKGAFGVKNGTAWVYNEASEVDKRNYWGQLATYEGGGFYQDLTLNQTNTTTIVQSLKAQNWLARASRVLFIDFTVYNANVNLFCVIRLVLEMPATGGFIQTAVFRTVRLLRYVNPVDYFIMFMEVVFVCFIAYYAVKEAKRMKKYKWKYFKSFWSWVEMVNICIAIVAVVFSLYRLIEVDRLLTGILAEPDKHSNFEDLAFWEVQYTNMIAFNVFIGWVKLFKYVSFNPTMNQLSCTLKSSAKDIFGFAIMFFIIFFAYAQLGYLVFGSQLDDFKTFGDSVFTLFRIILGDFDFKAIQDANRVLGPIFFITYVFFVFFILINMFLAIITDAYAEVKERLSKEKDEVHLGEFLKKNFGDFKHRMSTAGRRMSSILHLGKSKRKSQGGSEDVIAEEGEDIPEATAVGSPQPGVSEMPVLAESVAGSNAFAFGGAGSTTQEGSISGADGEVSNAHLENVKMRVGALEQSLGQIAVKLEKVITKLERLGDVPPQAIGAGLRDYRANNRSFGRSGSVGGGGQPLPDPFETPVTTKGGDKNSFTQNKMPPPAPSFRQNQKPPTGFIPSAARQEAQLNSSDGEDSEAFEERQF